MILEVLFEKRNLHAACQLKDLKLAPEYQNKMLHNTRANCCKIEFPFKLCPYKATDSGILCFGYPNKRIMDPVES